MLILLRTESCQSLLRCEEVILERPLPRLAEYLLPELLFIDAVELPVTRYWPDDEEDEKIACLV